MRCALLVLLGACGHLDFDPVGGSPAAAYTAAVLLEGQYQGSFAYGSAGAMQGSSSVTFDGSTTRIDYGDVFAFAGAANYSFEVWVRPTVSDNSVRFIVTRQTDASPNNGYQLYFDRDFTLASRTVDGTEASYLGISQGLAANGWTHIVFTFDGSLPMMFIDGSVVACAQDAPAIGGGAGHFVVGDSAPGQFNKMNGQLDELAIYDHALAGDRVAAHFAAAR